MSQRNPLNERYTQERSGKTRKSAASAKPASKAASSVRIQSKPQPEKRGFFGGGKSNDSASKSKDSDNKRVDLEYYNPDTPEYRKWRRTWLVLLVSALLLTMLSVLVSQFGWADRRVGYVLLGVGYALFFGAIVVDFAKVRKHRKAYQAAMTGADGKSKEATRLRKEMKAANKKKAEEEAAAKSQGETLGQSTGGGLLKGLFGKKGSGVVTTGPGSTAAPGEADKAATKDA